MRNITLLFVKLNEVENGLELKYYRLYKKGTIGSVDVILLFLNFIKKKMAI